MNVNCVLIVTKAGLTNVVSETCNNMEPITGILKYLHHKLRLTIHIVL